MSVLPQQTLQISLPTATAPEDIIDVALRTVRRHLGMEVAYLSEFVGDRSVFRAVSAPGLEALIKPGDSIALREVYCQHILAGRLPNVIPDTSKEPIALSLAITSETPIGSHVSVPVHRPDGEVYGMFCCLSPSPKPDLNDRDLAVMNTFADLAKSQIHATLQQRQLREEAIQRIDRTLERRDFAIVLQPIFALGATQPYGFEALCRFAAEPYRAPNIWFDEAGRVGRQLSLEATVIDAALAALDQLPAHVSLSINAAPATIASGELRRVFAGRPHERIVLEVTEHAIVDDYDRLAEELGALVVRGVRVAIDDAGAGHSGLSHILRTRPHIIKLDMALTRNVDSDLARQALVKAMVHFAEKTDAFIVAEGIETETELAALRELGVHYGQGYLLGRPGTLAEAVSWFESPVLAAGGPCLN